MRWIITLLLAAGLTRAQQPRAYVLGQPVTGQRPGTPVQPEPWKAVAGQIQRALIENYSRKHGLEPTAQEVAALRARMKAATAGTVVGNAADELRETLIRNGVDEQTARRQARAFSAEESSRDEQFVLSLIRYWKFGRALFQKHGGRVRLSAFGFQDPMDAMERFLIEEEKLGNFSIPDPEFRAKVWAVFQDKTGGDGTVSGARAAEVFARPPWEQPLR